MKEKAASLARAIRCPGGRSAGASPRGRREAHRARERADPRHIDMRLDEVGDGLEPRFERIGLARLHEPQVALGQGDGVAARQRADDRDAQRLNGVGRKAAVALAADPVQDHAGQAQPVVVSRAALDDRRGRLRLAGDVERQEHRKAEDGGDVGRGAARPAGAGTPSKRPIEASQSAIVRPAHAPAARPR